MRSVCNLEMRQATKSQVITNKVLYSDDMLIPQGMQSFVKETIATYNMYS